PDVIACDLHPAYYTTKLAEELPASRIIKVQHHHAHIVSAMAEHGIEGEVIGMAMDGTGYGLDGTVWGGEFLVAEEAAFTRIGHIMNYLLPGGEKAIREPWRIAVSLLREAYGDNWQEAAEELQIVPEKSYYETMNRIMEQKFNSPLTSSLGRLFDGVAALLGVRKKVTFEGQAAMELEAMAKGETDVLLPFDIRETGNVFSFDFSPMIRNIVDGIRTGRSRAEIARSFHMTLPVVFRDMAVAIRRRTGIDRVVLSGGCFQNRILTEGTIAELEMEGFLVFFHDVLPANDGCISLGQAVCAGAQVMRGT
ncbi:MAG: carbamoyltransferase HypF, partial [Syntrophaceae bacterium]|nr:carbamoyltransferase HypF [Syntrophaceae bacterium]